MFMKDRSSKDDICSSEGGRAADDADARRDMKVSMTNNVKQNMNTADDRTTYTAVASRRVAFGWADALAQRCLPWVACI